MQTECTIQRALGTPPTTCWPDLLNLGPQPSNGAPVDEPGIWTCQLHPETPGPNETEVLHEKRNCNSVRDKSDKTNVMSVRNCSRHSPDNVFLGLPSGELATVQIGLNALAEGAVINDPRTKHLVQSNVLLRRHLEKLSERATRLHGLRCRARPKPFEVETSQRVGHFRDCPNVIWVEIPLCRGQRRFTKGLRVTDQDERAHRDSVTKGRSPDQRDLPKVCPVPGHVPPRLVTDVSGYT